MAKRGTWPRRRHGAATPSDSAKDPICHPRLTESGRSQEKGGCPTHTGLTEGLGRAPERWTLRGWASDMSLRAGPALAVYRARRRTHLRLSRPETPQQTPAPWGCTSSASGPARARDANSCPSGIHTPSMARKGASHVVTARTSPGPLADSWCSCPSFRGPSWAHTSHGPRWTLHEAGVTRRTTLPSLPRQERGCDLLITGGWGGVLGIGESFGGGGTWRVYL